MRGLITKWRSIEPNAVASLSDKAARMRMYRWMRRHKISFRAVTHQAQKKETSQEIIKDFVDYIDPKGLNSSHNNEWSHATMHNHLHFTMVDGNFSLSNLLFFPYHSWIDIQLEMKLRMCNYESQAKKMAKRLHSYSNREEYFDPLLNPSQKKQKFGDYPILEWCDPRFVNSSARKQS